MTIYILLLIIVIIFSRFIEKNINSKIGKIAAFILILILSAVAGIRTIDMGWDASKYVSSTFYRLNYFNGNFDKLMNSTTVEFGFTAYSYILYKINPNINFLLFGYSLLTTILIFAFAFIEKKNIKFSLVIIIYYFILYLVSFNIIRQAISVAFALLAYSMMKRNCKIKCILLTILTCLFHSSGIFFIFIIFLYYYFQRKKNNNSKMNSLVFISFIIIICACIYPSIVKMAYNIGILNYKYYSYMLVSMKVDYNLSNILFMFYWLCVGFVAITGNMDDEEKGQLIFNELLIFIAFIINIVSIKIHPIYRIGFYFYYLGLFNMFPSLAKYFKNNKDNYKIIIIISSILLVLWLLWITVLGNSYNIYPYKSIMK